MNAPPGPLPATGAIAVRPGDGARSARTLAFAGLRIRVVCDRRADLLWLEEFLAPHFASLDGDDAPGHVTVELRGDAVELDRRVARGAHPSGALRDAFALDNSVIRFPEWTSEAGESAFYDETSRLLYLVRRDEARITLLAAETGPPIRTSLMRTVRELAMSHGQRDGGFFLHASAVALRAPGADATGGATDVRGLVVAGPKAAGKTSLLLHLLREGARYLSNDRVLVRLEPDPPALRGMPTIVTIRPGTLDLIPEVGGRLRASGFQHRLSAAEIAARPDERARPYRDGRFSVAPAQLCALADARQVIGAGARAIAFPQVTGAPGGIEIVAVPPGEAARRLEDCLFGVRTWRKTVDAFALHEGECPPDPDALADRCRRLVERVPCWEWRLGTEAYAAGSGRAALERVLG